MHQLLKACGCVPRISLNRSLILSLCFRSADFAVVSHMHKFNLCFVSLNLNLRLQIPEGRNMKFHLLKHSVRSNTLVLLKVIKCSWLKLSWLYLLKSTKQFIRYNCILSWELLLEIFRARENRSFRELNVLPVTAQKEVNAVGLGAKRNSFSLLNYMFI